MLQFVDYAHFEGTIILGRTRAGEASGICKLTIEKLNTSNMCKLVFQQIRIRLGLWPSFGNLTWTLAEELRREGTRFVTRQKDSWSELSNILREREKDRVSTRP